MTRTYAAKRLLEHGPLTAREFVEITGWLKNKAYKTLEYMIQTGQLVLKRETPKAPRRYHLHPDYVPESLST